MQNHPNSKFGPIFISINRFNFQGLVLISYLLSIVMHLPITRVCHLIFHSLHYHSVIWDHLLIVLIMFLTLIKTVTIVTYSSLANLGWVKTSTFAPRHQTTTSHLYPCFILSILTHLPIWPFISRIIKPFSNLIPF
jgi:hypothetical protein